MTLPKESKIKKKYHISESLAGILVFIDIPLFIFLWFVSLEENIKLFIIASYSIASLPSLYLFFVCYYKFHEMDKDDFINLKKITDYNFKRKLIYVIPIIFSIVIIYYVYVYFDNQSPTLIPGSSGITLGAMFLALLGHYGYTTALPSSVAKEFNFYLAAEYFEKAKLDSDKKMNVKKINDFIKGLDSYDKYLRKTFKHRIAKNRISSKLMADSKLNLDDKIKEICQAFQPTDKILPLKKMSELFKDVKSDELVVRISKFDMFKESTDAIISVIPAAIAIVGFLLGT
jgi:hypothetical protein